MPKIVDLIRKSLLPGVVISFFCVGALNAQNTITKTKKTLDDLTGLVHSTTALAAALNQLAFVTSHTTAEFNQNVKVSKGNDVQNVDNTPHKKLNPPIIKNDEFTNLKWDPITYFNGELFPSSIICMANYSGNLQGQLEAISRPIGFKIISPVTNIPLKWEIECVDKKYFDKVSGTVLYSDAKKETDVMPVIPWNYESLARQVSSVPVGIYFRLYDEKGNKIEKLVNLSFRSINDCIFHYKDLPLEFLFAGFVQESHPEVEKIKKEAVDTKMIKELNGYQGGETNVDLQVAAIWRALHERGITYSNISASPSNTNQDIRSQEVRTFDNSIKTTHGNSVDGAIVFASVLRSIGIHSALILTPGHCFLGYYTEDGKNNIKYVETTMLSQTSYVDKKTRKTILLTQAKTADQKSQAYMGIFQSAVDKGAMEYKQSEVPGNGLTVVDIDAMRDLVKTPIPFYTN